MDKQNQLLATMGTRHWVAFILVGSVAGSTFLWNKLALLELSPVQLLMLRFGLGTTFLLAINLAMRSRWPRTLHAWKAPLVLGLFNITTPHLLIVWAQQHVDSTITGILNATTPLFTLFIAHVVLQDDRLSTARLAGASLSFFGVVLVMSRSLGRGISGTLLGQVAILGSAISFGASSVVARRLRTDLTPIVLAFTANGIAWFAICLIGLVTGVRPIVPTLPATWVALGFLGLFHSGIIFVIFYFLLESIGPSRTQMVGYLIPVVAVALGAIFLGETVYWTMIVGGLMIIGGIAGANIAPAAPKET